MVLKKTLCVLAIVGLAGGTVAGCETIEQETGLGQKAQIGAVGGATAGGLLAAAVGASPLGIAAGVILGGVAGGAIGDMIDDSDKEQAAKAQQQAMANNADGQTTSWTDPSDGHSGTYTPQNTYVGPGGRTCRDFRQTVTIDGNTETAVGTACKMDDGSWRVFNA